MGAAALLASCPQPEPSADIPVGASSFSIALNKGSIAVTPVAKYHLVVRVDGKLYTTADIPADPQTQNALYTLANNGSIKATGTVSVVVTAKRSYTTWGFTDTICRLNSDYGDNTVDGNNININSDLIGCRNISFDGSASGVQQADMYRIVGRWRVDVDFANFRAQPNHAVADDWIYVNFFATSPSVKGFAAIAFADFTNATQHAPSSDNSRDGAFYSTDAQARYVTVMNKNSFYGQAVRADAQDKGFVRQPDGRLKSAKYALSVAPDIRIPNGPLAENEVTNLGTLVIENNDHDRATDPPTDQPR